MLFTLIGGVLADRHDRRRTLLASQYVQMATSAALALLMYLRVVQIWHILLLSFITGVRAGLRRPGVPVADSVARRQEEICRTPSRSTRSSSTSRACSVRCSSAPRSPSSPSWGYSEPQAMNACFALNALSFLVVIYTLMSLHVKHIPPPTRQRDARRAARAALRYVRHHGSLVALIVLAAATTFLGFAVLTFLPLFAQRGVSRRGRHLQPSDGVFGRRLDRRRADRRVARKIQADGTDRAAACRRCTAC